MQRKRHSKASRRSFTAKLFYQVIPSAAISIFVTAAVVFAWTEPTVAPPRGNIASPVDISATGQSKSGKLGISVGAFDSAYGLTVGDASNPVGIKSGGSSYFEKDITAVTRILNGNGSASAPAYSFGAETNTGIYHNALNRITLAVNGLNAMTVNGASGVGRVGIGTLTPMSTLDVRGIILANNGSAGAPSWSFNTDGNTGIYRVAADKLGITANGLNAITIDGTSGSGRVGIGTLTPQTLLDVAGDVRSSSLFSLYKTDGGYFKLYNMANESAMSQLKLTLSECIGAVGTTQCDAGYMKDMVGHGWDNWMQVNRTAPLNMRTITMWGDVYANIVGAPSDQRLKEDIKPLGGVLDKLVKMQGITFDWNQVYQSFFGKTQKKQEIGLLAQSVETEFPELVSVMKFANGEEYKTVDYTRLSVALLEGIKELNEKTGSADKELYLKTERQQEEINQLKEEIKILKSQR